MTFPDSKRGESSSQAVQDLPVTSNNEVQSKKRIRIDRFIRDPQMFRGTASRGQTLVTEARLWLEKMNVLKESSDWSDAEMLYVAGDHLSDRARRWWALKNNEIKTWTQFKEAFTEQFLNDLTTNYWKMLQEMRHEDYESVDDLTIHMEEIFNLMGLTDDAFRLRIFLSALKPAIGYEVEKDPMPDTFDIAKVKARKAERTFYKYNVDTTKVYFASAETHSKLDNSPKEMKTVAETMMTIAEKLEKIQISMDQLEKQRTPYQGGYRNPTNSNNRGNVYCYACGEDGHKSYQCTNRGQGGPSNFNNGPGQVPTVQQSGKGQEQQ
jgi:hypothetical protein